MMPDQSIPMMTTEPNYNGAPMSMGYMPTNLINGPHELSQCTWAIIRKQVEMFEVLTGCETQNRYYVFLQSSIGLKYSF